MFFMSHVFKLFLFFLAFGAVWVGFPGSSGFSAPVPPTFSPKYALGASFGPKKSSEEGGRF